MASSKGSFTLRRPRRMAMDAERAAGRPGLALVKTDIDSLASLYERITGQKPTQEELQAALADMHRAAEGTPEAAELPEVYFGNENAGKTDWRGMDDGAPDMDDDEEGPTPEDVTAMLGFDPLELGDD